MNATGNFVNFVGSIAQDQPQMTTMSRNTNTMSIFENGNLLGQDTNLTSGTSINPNLNSYVGGAPIGAGVAGNFI